MGRAIFSGTGWDENLLINLLNCLSYENYMPEIDCIIAVIILTFEVEQCDFTMHPFKII